MQSAGELLAVSVEQYLRKEPIGAGSPAEIDPESKVHRDRYDRLSVLYHSL